MMGNQEQMNIQWYPGHMTKTRRQIEADLKQVDAVCEIVDARIPISSRNPDIDSICGSKPRIIVLNRMDLAGDVIIILMLKPLVLSGIIGFFSAYICLCEECLKKVITRENELQEKLLKISELMHKETSENISCNLSRDSNGIAYLAVRVQND